MQRIAFVIPNMSGGGAPPGGAARVAAILCSEWAALGHAVHLVTYEKVGTASFYPLDQRIVHHQIGLSVSRKTSLGFLANNAARVLRLRRVLKQISPTTVVAFLLETNIAAVLASQGLDAKVLISERNHPGHHKISAMRERARKLVYPYADRLCVQTEDIRQWFTKHLNLDAVVIPNPAQVFVEPVDLRSTPAPSGRLRAISVGRLAPQKGFDRLIDAFAHIQADVPDWDLVIVGEGALRAQLQEQIARHGLMHRISLPGATQKVDYELSRSHLYVHAARFEGFPNAIVEALHSGLCVIAMNSPGATGELLGGGHYGMLVSDGDIGALGAIMRGAMLDDELRTQYALRAREALQSLSPNIIAARWIEEIERLGVRSQAVTVNAERHMTT